MLDDFFTRALIAGTGLAVAAGPLGCFLVWRRMAYFGDTIAHAALLGVAFALFLDVPLMAGVFVTSLGVSVTLIVLERSGTLPTDALLGILAHSTLALGIVLIALLPWVRIDLMSLLFGDVLAVSVADLGSIYATVLVVLVAIAIIWRSLLAGTVDADIARSEGLAPDRARFVYMVLMAAIVAVAMKIVGILLITSLLIIPAAAARQFAATPEQMALLAALFGVAAVLGGLFGSLHFDTPSGPSVVVCALLLFLASLAGRALCQKRQSVNTGAV